MMRRNAKGGLRITRKTITGQIKQHELFPDPAGDTTDQSEKSV